MDNDKIENLLLKLVEDVAYVKARLEVMEDVQTEYKELATKIEKLEMQNERHERQLKSVENRANVMEQFVRNNMNNEKQGGWKALGAIGMCILSALVTFVFSFFK